MRSIGERLIERVQHFQQATGETAMLLCIEKQDQGMGIHQIGYDPHVGLLVDGKPPSFQWYQEAEDFHPLQWAPSVLH